MSRCHRDCWRGSIARAAFPAVAVVVSLAGCAARPIQEVVDSGALEVRILATSTRVFRPGQGGRFVLAMTNRSSRRIGIGRLEVTLEASPVGHPDVRSLSGHWKYPMPATVVLPPGREFSIPLKPEPIEFHLGGLLPGNYAVRAIVWERFVSEPFIVRVDRPDLPRGSRGRSP